MTKGNYPLLSKIDSPDDLRKLNPEKLPQLAKELRAFIIDIVSTTGGHFGGNLGAVELTIALHYIYDTPRDKIIWDVGAQAYPHKILTGRRKMFHTNSQYDGIAPFPKREESEYDSFGVGHSSTSISSALGMAIARDLSGEDYKVIAAIGDGGMTGGLAFEGLNNAGVEGSDITVVLNDNRMAISPNVGALSNHLAGIRADPRFEKLKDSMWQLTEKLPKRTKLRKALRGVDQGLRAMLVPGIWFERLGFRYVGPVDGHNLPELIRMFRWLKGVSGPVIIHILTEKGKGYKYAEEDSLRLHSIGKMDPQTGPSSQKGGTPDFSAHFSDELQTIARKDSNVVVITPAMIAGSKLEKFKEEFPDRCFDVGIAEQHAITFAAGLATQGIRPVVAVYSSFLQRAYDQVIHDVAVQNLPVVFGIDRAGLVGEDGPTHHGVFDISYLRHIPNMTVLVPRDEKQMRKMMRTALDDLEDPVAIRFPRGKSPLFEIDDKENDDVVHPEFIYEGTDGLIIGTGIILHDLLSVVRELYEQEGMKLGLVDLKCIKPLDTEFLTVMAARYSKWISVEENVLHGGVGSALLEFVSERELPVQIKRLGIPDRFITHGDRQKLLLEIGLDRQNIFETVKTYFLEKSRKTQRKKRKADIQK